MIELFGLLWQSATQVYYFFLSVAGSGSFPRKLTSAEEELYVRRCAEGDKIARTKLIEHNMRLVAHVLKKYGTTTGVQDDLLQIGNIGLIKAVDTFRADKKSKFSSYAARCIEKTILLFWLLWLRRPKRRYFLWQLACISAN